MIDLALLALVVAVVYGCAAWRDRGRLVSARDAQSMDRHRAAMEALDG